VGSGEVSRGEKMLYSGTDPESYITECTLVYEEKNLGVDNGRYPTEPNLVQTGCAQRLHGCVPGANPSVPNALW